MSKLEEFLESAVGNLSPQVQEAVKDTVNENNLSLTFPKSATNVKVKSTTANDNAEYQVGIAVAQLETGFKNMVKEVGASQADLTSITGDSRLSADASLDVVVLAPFAETVASAIDDFSEETVKSIESALKKDMDLDKIGKELDAAFKASNLDNVLGETLGSPQSTLSSLKSVVSDVQGIADKIIGSVSNGFGSFIENTIEQTLGPARNILNTVTGKGDVKIVLSKKETTAIIELLQSGKTLEAAKILQASSELTLQQAIDVVKSIDNSYTKQVKSKDAASGIDVGVSFIDLTSSQWRETATDLNDPRNFAPVIGREVYAELSNLERQFTQVIFVSTEPGKTMKDLHEEFVETQSIGVPYHFLVSNQGLVFRGRPLEKESPKYQGVVNNHNQKSIIVAIEGIELDQPSVPAQNKVLINLYKDILDAAPGVELFNDAQAGWKLPSKDWRDARPYSDPTKWLKSWYKRVPNTKFDPLKGEPLSLDYIKESYGS